MSEGATYLDATIREWDTSFEEERSSIQVEFRALLRESTVRDKYTHLLHPYPAKLLPHIPQLFLASKLVLRTEDASTVADPFCGSGTVLLEAVVHGFAAIGADTNPLARLISKVKTTPLDHRQISRDLMQVERIVRRAGDIEPPPVVNLRLWYSDRIIAELAKLRAAIKQIRSRSTREFMQVCLSVCVRRLSYADPRLSVPVRIDHSRKERYGPHYRQLSKHLTFLRKADAFQLFSNIVLRNMARVISLSAALQSKPNVTIFKTAGTLQTEVPEASVDIIITSPPYLGAQKYIRASSLSLGWLDMAHEGELRGLERITIGREHFPKADVGSVTHSGIEEADTLLRKVSQVNPLRAHIAWVYLAEMQEALSAMHRILKPGGNLILVSGPNTICGHQFDTPRFLEILANSAGFSGRFKLHDNIRSRGLMTKRHKTAGVINSECIICLVKPI
jgi:DNA modification methylase